MAEDDHEAEARALLEKNKKKLRRLKKEFAKAARGVEEPEGSIMLGPKDELSYRLLPRWKTAGKGSNPPGSEDVSSVLDLTRYGPSAVRR